VSISLLVLEAEIGRLIAYFGYCHMKAILASPKIFCYIRSRGGAHETI